MAEQRTYSGGRFKLSVGGYDVTYLKSFEGMSMDGTVATHDQGPDNIQRKHLANLKWTDGKATIGMGMGKGMYDWIKASFDKGHYAQNGEFISADFDYKAQSSLAFMNALIKEVTVPKLDAAGADPAYFTVLFDPEQVRWSKGGGETIQSKGGGKQKAWLQNNFHVEIGGLPTDRVSVVESFTWKCAVAQDHIGIHREPTKHPAKVTVPEIKLAISFADHQAWAEAAKKWFVDGAHEERDELDGAIKFLKPSMDRNDENGSVNLFGLGFKSFKAENAEANSEKIKRFNVELYCEQMKFDMKYVDA